MLNIGQRNDDQLVKRILNGRKEDFTVLVNRYISSVYSVAYTRTKNHTEAEDAVQESFLNAYRSLHTLREPAKFGPWVTTIARNVANRITAARNKESEFRTNSETVNTSSPDVETREIRSMVRKKVDELDETAREVLMLYYFAGHSTTEIAAMLNITESAARKRLQRARSALGETLMATWETDDDWKDGVKARSSVIAAAALSEPVDWSVAAGAGVNSLHPDKPVRCTKIRVSCSRSPFWQAPP